MPEHTNHTPQTHSNQDEFRYTPEKKKKKNIHRLSRYHKSKIRHIHTCKVHLIYYLDMTPRFHGFIWSFQVFSGDTSAHLFIKKKNTAQLQHVQKSSQKSRKIPTHPFLHPTFTKEKTWKSIFPRWFKMTFLSPSWRSLNLWKGHLSIPKRSQRIGWPRIVPSGKQSTDRVTRVSAGIGLLQSEVLSSLTHFSFTCNQLGKPVEREVGIWKRNKGGCRVFQKHVRKHREKQN